MDFFSNEIPGAAEATIDTVNAITIIAANRPSGNSILKGNSVNNPNWRVKETAISIPMKQIQISNQKLSINLQTDGLNKPIPNHVEMVLYRVIQESVNNVVKHAAASNLDIAINQEADGIDVLIEDNGKGFDSNKIIAVDGIGLSNIKNRVHYLKGTVEWNTAPGSGTLVAIHIPIVA